MPKLAPADASYGGVSWLRTGEKAVSDDLPQDSTLDRLGGRRGVGPPPPLLLHRPGGRHEPIRDRLEIGVGVVETEDQAPCSDPTQCQAFRAQIVLKHPVVARWLQVANR